jgi:hypothetical protein
VNPRVREFFERNPDARYFYATGRIRIINPKVWRDPLYRPDPWPDRNSPSAQAIGTNTRC